MLKTTKSRLIVGLTMLALILFSSIASYLIMDKLVYSNYEELSKIDNFLNAGSYSYSTDSVDGYFKFYDQENRIINILKDNVPGEISKEEYRERNGISSFIKYGIYSVNIKGYKYHDGVLLTINSYFYCTIRAPSTSRLDGASYQRYFVLDENAGKEIFGIVNEKIIEEKNKPF